MGEEPRTAIKDLLLLLRHVRLHPGEETCDGHPRTVVESPRTAFDRNPEPDAISLKPGRREKFRKSFHEPFGVGPIDILHHQMVRIFVIEDGVLVVVRQGVVGDIGEGAFDPSRVETIKETSLVAYECAIVIY